MNRLLLMLARTTFILSLTLSGIAAVSGTLAYAEILPAPCEVFDPECGPAKFDENNKFFCGGACIWQCKCVPLTSEDENGNTSYYCLCKKQ